MAIEIHKAIVSRVNDPQKQGRIRVKCQSLAAAGVELPIWVKPIFAFSSHGLADGEGSGWFAVPEPGSEVEIEVNVGDSGDETAGETFISHPDIHYRAAMYSSAQPLPAEFQTNYPHRRGLRTPSGHVLVFDDEPDKELIEMMHKDKKSFWRFTLVESAVRFVLDCAKVFIGETATLIILGKEADAKFVALAPATKSEISALRDTVNSLVTAFNSHTHMVSGVSTVVSGTAGPFPVVGAGVQGAPVPTAPPASPATPPAAVGEIAATVVKAK